uniref:Ubiquitin-like-conjugating enzyme ATG10 n=2 Tax=Scleropages formosus TaxID=113540 RepID=A0A8C9W892_SCLFO
MCGTSSSKTDQINTNEASKISARRRGPGSRPAFVLIVFCCTRVDFCPQPFSRCTIVNEAPPAFQMSSPRKLVADAMYLDEEGFRQCCELFLQQSCALDDGWCWEGFNGSADGYMKKTVLGRGKINTPSLDGSCKSEEDVCALGKETQEGAPDGSEWEALDAEWSAAIRYEYHVLYSSSYQTPVLYFRASALDGRPLSLEEMWDNVHPSYRRRLLHSPWDTITQQEHPCLGQPFFVLHPCRTWDFMSPILEAAQNECRKLNYIVSWLSVVGPMVGLEIPLSYATVASKPERTAAR